MRFTIRHEIRGRLRLHVEQGRMSFQEADILQYALSEYPFISKVTVQTRTQDVVICYHGERGQVLSLLRNFRYEDADVPEFLLGNTGRELNEAYKEKLVNRVVCRYVGNLLLPYPVRAGCVLLKSLPYLWRGIKVLWKRKMEVPVLDATAIGVSVFRGDIRTASSIMFLLGIGEILEEWTHKKSVDDLARSMSLHVGKVWLKQDGQETLVPSSQIRQGDRVVVRMGQVIPFDGIVVEGDGMVNQASLTGESVPVHKHSESYAYAGTALEEGELTICVDSAGGNSRFERIVAMIEESEKLKSSMEGKAAHLADKLVPYMLAGTGLTYLLTRNATKALSVLMVDFSCALKLAMPVSVLSAIREGRFLQWAGTG